MMPYKNVCLELDSSCVCHLISQGGVDAHVYAPLVNAVRNLIEETNGRVVIRHVYREDDACANV